MKNENFSYPTPHSPLPLIPRAGPTIPTPYFVDRAHFNSVFPTLKLASIPITSQDGCVKAKKDLNHLS